MLKRIFTFFAALLMLTCSPLPASAVSAQSAILIEAESGDVIFEQNADARLPMASTTKIMTALVALKSGDIDREIQIDNRAIGVEGSSVYLKSGEKLTMRQLLYAVMLSSANDAAAAVAYAVSGSIEAFAEEMNELAEEVGLTSTHFTNPHGLDDEAHYTTARDMAKLTAYALRNETFAQIVSTKTATIPSLEGQRTLVNHNKLLRLSEDVIGVKTGFTKRSGRCLVSAARRDGVTVIAVTLNAPDDWRDHLSMHQVGFDTYEARTVCEAGEYAAKLPCVGAPLGYLIASNRDSLTLTMRKDAEIDYIIEARRPLFAPIAKDEAVGSVLFYKGSELLGSVALYAEAEIAEMPDTRNFIEKLFNIG